MPSEGERSRVHRTLGQTSSRLLHFNTGQRGERLASSPLRPVLILSGVGFFFLRG